MREITTIGMDLAKNVFHVIGCDARGKVQLRKQLRRHQVLAWFARLKPCRVGMEACASSHYWGRELRKLGHEVKLIAAQHVKAFLRGNKNDYNDALAIAEAVVRPEMRFVAIKSAQEQDIQALCRLREQRVFVLKPPRDLPMAPRHAGVFLPHRVGVHAQYCHRPSSIQDRSHRLLH